MDITSKADVEWLAEALREQTAAFAEAVAGLDPGARVPTCPEWRLRDLVAHIGQADRWAAGLVRTGEAVPVPDPRDAEPGRPHEWSRWLLDGAAELAGAVREADAGATVWAFVGRRPPAFWLRRMLHDTSVHRADAALAAGTAFTLAPELAADAISETLGLLSAPGTAKVKPALAELRGRGESLLLRPEERSTAGWRINRTPAGVAWDRTADGADGPVAGADVTVAGAARDLLLVLARRMAPDDPRLTVIGDRGLLDHWVANTAL